ncbi:MAG: hypothetical protein Q8T09_05780 [Candidatus Melainabacteria bacterium]|nr:hypothetical protein [Candidatus Melainabacteria bacterium]
MIITRLLGLCVSLLIVTSLCSPTRVYAHSPLHSLDATYVPWGVDEDELIGLTKADLANKYKDTLGFDAVESRVFFVDYNRPKFGRPGFTVTFADGKIVAIKRLFIDGGGCHIVGPVFKTKKEALNFVIEGLSKLTNRNAKDEARLKEARKRQIALDGK